MSDVVDLSAHRSPVNYTVRISQHWDGRVEVLVEDVADDDRSREAVADALTRAADAWRKLKPRESNTQQHERLLRCISAAMGCLDPESVNADERLAWYRLYDAEMGREPRDSLDATPSTLSSNPRGGETQ